MNFIPDPSLVPGRSQTREKAFELIATVAVRINGRLLEQIAEPKPKRKKRK